MLEDAIDGMLDLAAYGGEEISEPELSGDGSEMEEGERGAVSPVVEGDEGKLEAVGGESRESREDSHGEGSS